MILQKLKVLDRLLKLNPILCVQIATTARMNTTTVASWMSLQPAMFEPPVPSADYTEPMIDMGGF
jgi:hypothetical protein